MFTEAQLRSPLTGCQVTSRPRDRFSRYSKWLDTFRTALVHGVLYLVCSTVCTERIGSDSVSLYKVILKMEAVHSSKPSEQTKDK